MNNLPKRYDQLEAYIREINKYSILTKEEEFELARKVEEDDDPNAAAQLINANLRFVVKIAYQYKNYGFKLTDLIQEGNYGLIMAVKKFDRDKGFRLITYAVWWIKAYIKNYIINNWSLIKVGTTQAQKRLFFKIKEEMRKNDIMLLSTKNVKQLAEDFKVKDDEIINMNNRLSSKDFQLDAKISYDGDNSHMDMLSDKEIIDIEEKTIIKEQASLVGEKIKEAYQYLSDIEKIIYNERLIAEYPKTLQELGEKLNLSRERIRQIEVKTKKKIKKYLEAECDYDIEV
jgi:RNA polymerase sigma-32 factor